MNEEALAKARSFERFPCRAVGTFSLRTGDPLIDIRLVDVSAAGCKFRMDDETEAKNLIAALPSDFDMTIGTSHMQGSIVWYTGNLFGCRFYDLASLDEISLLMRGGVRITLHHPHKEAANEDKPAEAHPTVTTAAEDSEPSPIELVAAAQPA